MKRTLSLSVLLVGFVLALGAYLYRSERSPQGPLERGSIIAHAQALDAAVDLAAPTRTEVAIPEVSRLRVQLREIWGRDFDANCQRAVEMGIDLDAQIELRTWNEVREATVPHFTVQEKERNALLRNYIDWPDAITVDYLVALEPTLDRALLNESVLLAVEGVAAATNREIAAEATLLVDQIATAKSSMIDSPHLAKSLLLPPPSVSPRGGDMLYAGAGNAANWQFNYTVFGEDFPEIPKQKALVKALKKKRRAEIEEFLSTLH